VLVLAPGTTAQQMNGEHMRANRQMMDDAQMMGGNMRASSSALAGASPSASASPTVTASAPRGVNSSSRHLLGKGEVSGDVVA
jgi:hypothetical protein